MLNFHPDLLFYGTRNIQIELRSNRRPPIVLFEVYYIFVSQVGYRLADPGTITKSLDMNYVLIKRGELTEFNQ